MLSKHFYFLNLHRWSLLNQADLHLFLKMTNIAHILQQLEQLHACFSWERCACENHVWCWAAAERQYLLSRGRAERWQQQLGSGQDGFQSSVPSRPGCCNYEDVKEDASQVRRLNTDKCPKAEAQFGVSPAGRLSLLWPFLGSTHHSKLLGVKGQAGDILTSAWRTWEFLQETTEALIWRIFSLWC